MRKPFRSHPAQVATAALRADDVALPAGALALECAVRQRWQSAVLRWFDEKPAPGQPPLIGDGARDRWYHCRPSLLRTRFARNFCYQRWLCPFCYHRELVSFLTRAGLRDLDCKTVTTPAPDPAAAWEQTRETRSELQRWHQGLLTWQFLRPSVGTWEIRTTYIFPGTFTLLELLEPLATSMAYPYVWLDFPAAAAADIAAFHQRHRGRTVSGIYREHNDHYHRKPPASPHAV